MLKSTKLLFIFILNLIIFISSNSVIAASISDIEIVVKETIINAQGFNPISGEPLSFGHIGSLSFEFNDEPNKCLAKVSGFVYENESESSKSNVQFLVCVKKDIDGTIWGEVLNLTYLP